MNKSSINLSQIDLSFPVELVLFQYDIELPSLILFLTWLLEGGIANHWTQYISDGERCYVDLNTQKSPYCIMMPLVVFRYHFCQWHKENAPPEISQLLNHLFNDTMHWRKAQADMISINFYMTD
ncbi:TPA: hypothetical protein QB563_001079 [Pasteurella multocida]|nr:hypothetical protein [Pasteurella multocida]HED4466392.1 hypothetical protein [Pasteurella multocida]